MKSYKTILGSPDANETTSTFISPPLFFADGVIMLHDIGHWATMFVSDHNFAAKYYFGMPRPEEVIWAIVQDEIDKECLPDTLYDKIMEDFGAIQSPPDFTAYPDGSPRVSGDILIFGCSR